jgi:hypothetical protein
MRPCSNRNRAGRVGVISSPLSHDNCQFWQSAVERSPSPSLGSNVLLFPLFVTQMTVELVREAMTAVKQRTAHLMARALGGPSRKQLQKELRSGP